MIKNIKPFNVLITSVGRRVELVNLFKKNLKKQFKNGKVYVCDNSPHFSAACQVADEYFKSPLISDKKYINFLLNLCKKKGVGILIPTIDTDLKILSKNKDKFYKFRINIICSNYEIIKICSDKRLVAKYFSNMQINTPKIYSYKNIKFPCFAKPYDGSSSIGAEKIMNRNHFYFVRKNNRKTIFMRYLNKNFKEYTVDAYYDKYNVLKCAVPRKRIEVRGGEISKGETKKNYIYRLFKKKFNRMSNVTGPINVQIMVDEKSKKMFFIEINPRFGGGFPLSYNAGANFIKMIIDEYLLEKKINFKEDWKKDQLSLRFDQSIDIHKNA